MLRGGIIVAALMCGTAALGQTTADGTTATTVTVGADGVVTVGVATPNVDGTSLNHYTNFNVPKAGTNLDNRIAAARTIVNEVTGADLTNINGQVEVLGQRAHVIIANQNGIRVNGGRFVNTGRVALTTGAISTNSREIAPGFFQDNIVSTVNGGTIEIMSGGLSGQMDMLDLVAHQIRIGGPVSNDNTDVLSGINIVAGKSEVEFDSSIVPGNLNQAWEAVTSRGTGSGEVLFELTLPGAIRANNVEILVTEAGAGARLAGEGLASARDFRLTSDGTIEVDGASLQAQGQLVLEGREVVSSNSSYQSVAEDVTLTATAGGISDSGSTFTTHEDVIFNAMGPVALSDTTVRAGLAFRLDTTGSVTTTRADITAEEDVLVRASDVSLSFGQVVAKNGTLNLQTTSGDLNVTGALLQGAQQTTAALDATSPANEGAVTLNIAGNVNIANSGDDLGIIFGSAGDVVLRTGGDIVNTGGRILSNNDLRLVAAGDVLNIIDLPGGTNSPVITEYTKRGKRQWWTLWLKRKRETYVEYDFGIVERPDQLATMTASGSVFIEGQKVLNQGGEINANGGDVTITAVDIETVGVGSGRVAVRKVCVFTCSYETEGDGVSILGGSINATRDVNLTASNSIKLLGGQILGQNDVNMTAPNVQLEATLVPGIGRRPGGLYNFWSSDAAWLYLRDQFGSVIADTGNLTVTSDNPVALAGGSLSAGGQVITPGGVNTLYAPRTESPTLTEAIGLFHDIEPVRQ